MGKGNNKMLEKIVYKVLSDDYKSYAVRGSAQVTYSLSYWAKPPLWLSEKGYYLTAFENFDDAMNFINNFFFFDSHIWEAKAKGIHYDLPLRLDIASLNCGQIRHTFTLNWPKGTIMCERIKLIKHIL